MADITAQTGAAEPVAAARPRSRRTLKTAVGFGLVVGWVELVSVLARGWFDPRVSMNSLRTNRHYVWMIPVADVTLLAAVGLLVTLYARRRPGFPRRHAWRLYVGLGGLAWLSTFEGLYPVACVVLSLGVGLRFGPGVKRLAARFRRPARAGFAVGAGALAVLVCADYAWVVSAERRASASLPAAPAGVPNLLLVVLDNVRAESLSLYGHGRPTTPNLERLARKGVVFTHARSPAPWTLASHASIFTARWPSRLSFDWDRPLSPTHPTLAGYLAGQGYATAGFVGNSYYCNARYGLGRGFARYQDCYENETVSPTEVVRSSGLGKFVLRGLGYPIHVEDGGTSVRKTAAMITRDFLGWLDGRPPERPFFVFLNYFDAHSPFVPPPGPDPRFGFGARASEQQIEILRRSQRLAAHTLRPGEGPPERIEREATAVLCDSYESCIAYLDRQLGLLFDELERRDLLRETLVIVTSDHGEHFKEHGFSGHGLSLYRREVHVPLLVFDPYRGQAGLVVDEPVSLRDLAATSVDLLGLGERSPFPGETLKGLRRSGAASNRVPPSPPLSEVGHQRHLPPTAVVPATLGPLQSLVLGGKVYIRNGDGREELYDLWNDPLERINLADGTRPAPLEPFRRALDQLLTPSADAPQRPAIGEEMD